MQSHILPGVKLVQFHKNALVLSYIVQPDGPVCLVLNKKSQVPVLGTLHFIFLNACHFLYVMLRHSHSTGP